MKSIFVFLLLANCDFNSANIFGRYELNRRSFLKKHVTLQGGLTIDQAPYIAAVTFEDYNISQDRYSTAAIITKRFLISVLNCQLLPRNGTKGYATEGYKVYVGYENLLYKRDLVYGVEEFIPRDPSYENGKFYYGIMLIKVDQDIEYNESVMPIALLSKKYYEDYENHLCNITLVGYGRAHQVKSLSCMGKLQSKSLDICRPDLRICRRDLKSCRYLNLPATTFSLDSGNYTCAGDIGTPAITDNKLAGLFSKDKDIVNDGLFVGIIDQYEWITCVVGKEDLGEAEKHAYKHRIDHKYSSYFQVECPSKNIRIWTN